MISRMFVYAALFGTMAPLGAMAADDCGPGDTEVLVVVNAPSEKLDRRLSASQLGSMQIAKSLPGGITQGVTAVSYNASYSTDFVSTERSDGLWCSRAAKVTVNFGFSEPPVIYLASGLLEGSCLYGEILAHEYQHLSIARDTLTAGGKWLDQGVRTVVSKGGVVARTPEAANAVIDQEILDTVNRITTGLYAAAKTKNLALDTPQNYAKLGKRC